MEEDQEFLKKKYVARTERTWRFSGAKIKINRILDRINTEPDTVQTSVVGSSFESLK